MNESVRPVVVQPEASTSHARLNEPQRPRVIHPAASSNTIVVNPCQKGNPVLNHIRNMPYEWGDIVPDYQVGATTGVLYLSSVRILHRSICRDTAR
jgi:DNA excision repair protein ERCC-1